MNDESNYPKRTWANKFGDSFRGLKAGMRGQSSFYAHFFVAVLVIAAGLIFQIERWEWCALTLCIAGIITAEMFNSSLESMAKAITGKRHPHLGNSLDIGSAAVLTASIGAAVVGAIVFLPRLAAIFQG
jgi:diacylglycerol kinase (ATP)